MRFDDDPLLAQLLKRLWLTWTLALLFGLGGLGIALQLIGVL